MCWLWVVEITTMLSSVRRLVQFYYRSLFEIGFDINKPSSILFWILLVVKVKPQHPTTLFSFSCYPKKFIWVHGERSKYDFIKWFNFGKISYLMCTLKLVFFIFLFQHNCISNLFLPLGLSKKCSFWTNMEEQKRKPRGNA